MAAVVIVECDAQKLYDRGMGIERMVERCKMRESVGLVCFVFEVVTHFGNATVNTTHIAKVRDKVMASVV